MNPVFRYYDDVLGFQPGILSSALREALGLKEGEQPPYYSAMQRIGYPPGWTLKSVNSGLSIIDDTKSSSAPQLQEEEEEDIQTVNYPGLSVSFTYRKVPREYPPSLSPFSTFPVSPNSYPHSLQSHHS